MRRLHLLLLPVVVLLGLTAVVLLPQTASAATFTVDSTADNGDDVLDGTCDDGAGNCTLRAAIEEANSEAGADDIEFNIAGGGVQTITLTSDLPDIAESLSVDGTTQTGASCGTLVPSLPAESNTPHTLLIEIDGDGNDIFYMTEAADTYSYSGLVLNDFDDGILSFDFNATGSLAIECNYIGTNPDGDTDDNDSDLQVPTADISNNLISGNTLVSWRYGVFEDNLVGTNATGMTAIPNEGGFSTGALSITAASNSDTTVVQNNVISGNDLSGIYMSSGDSPDVTIESNFIGLDLAGNPLGNGEDGITIGHCGSDHTIPASVTITNNTISANTENGIDTVGPECGDGSASELANITIAANLIGTNTDGEVEDSYGNGINGINLCSSGEFVLSGEDPETICGSWAGSEFYDITVGGSNAASANTIAGNGFAGIFVEGNEGGYDAVAKDIVIQNNDIFSNDIGIVYGGYSTRTTENTIYNNTLDGVRVIANTADGYLPNSNAVYANSIFGNGQFGIELTNYTTYDNLCYEGYTGEDAYAFQQLGPNGLLSLADMEENNCANDNLNAPQIADAESSEDEVTITYDFEPNYDWNYEVVGYRLDFYINDAGDDGAYEGYSQGKTHLGSFIVDDSGESGSTHTFTSLVELDGAEVITSTATVLLGDEIVVDS